MTVLQFAKESNEDNKKELEAAILKQRAIVDDVKRAAAIAGSEKDRKTQIDEIMKERSTYADKVRSLSDLNRRTVRQLSEEINPRLNSITNKIKQLENSKNIKLEVRICVTCFVAKRFFMLVFLVATDEIRSSLSGSYVAASEPKSI